MKHEGKDYVFKNEVEYFDSFSEAMEVCEKQRKPRKDSMFSPWAGGITGWDHAREMNSKGYEAGAKKLTKSFDAASLATMTTQGEEMQLDYVGFTPCVPSFLAGEPMHMRRRVEAETSKAPITIVVGSGSSGGIDVKDMEERAAAIACLILYLSVYRAVTVYSTCFIQSTNGADNFKDTDYYFPMIKIGTTPMELPQLAWQLVHPFNARGVIYSLTNIGSNGIGWAHFNGKSAYLMEAKELREVAAPILGLLEDDILIPDCKLRDKDMANPEQWAKTRMRQMGYNMD